MLCHHNVVKLEGPGLFQEKIFKCNELERTFFIDKRDRKIVE